jgi:hypothetical protein
LTLLDQQVTAFSIRSPDNFAYTVLSRDTREKALRESRAASIVGTGRDLYGLMMPTDFSMTTIYQDLSELWTVVNGKRFRVEDKSSGGFDAPGQPRDVERHRMYRDVARKPLDELQPSLLLRPCFRAIGSMHQLGNSHHGDAEFRSHLELPSPVQGFPERYGLCVRQR